MLSKTLTDGLSRYAIGDKIRRLRLKKKLGLVELGKHTGLSPALLSKVERGRLFPTLPTLLRISLVFGVGLDYFFVDERQHRLVALVRRGDRVRLPDVPGGRGASYDFEALNYTAEERKLDAYLAEFRPAPSHPRTHEHDGVEFVYVIRGKLRITIGEDSHTLATGDAIYFEASVPHAYHRVGNATCQALVVVTT